MQKPQKSTSLNTLDFMKWQQSLKNNLVWTKCSSITLVSENIWVSVCILPVECDKQTRIVQSRPPIEVNMIFLSFHARCCLALWVKRREFFYSLHTQTLGGEVVLQKYELGADFRNKSSLR